MTFERGQFVRITCAGRTLDGMVLIVSPNQVSMMLGFAGVLPTSTGGAYIGSMPVELDEAGVYRDLIQGDPVTIEQVRRDH